MRVVTASFLDPPVALGPATVAPPAPKTPPACASTPPRSTASGLYQTQAGGSASLAEGDHCIVGFSLRAYSVSSASGSGSPVSLEGSNRSGQALPSPCGHRIFVHLYVLDRPTRTYSEMPCGTEGRLAGVVLGQGG
jgi:hypothetical protein